MTRLALSRPMCVEDRARREGEPAERGPRLRDMLQSWNFGGDKYVLPGFQNERCLVAVLSCEERGDTVHPKPMCRGCNKSNGKCEGNPLWDVLRQFCIEDHMAEGHELGAERMTASAAS